MVIPVKTNADVDKSNDVEKEVKHEKIGPWKAGWNISNCILSICILNEPYAVLQSGISGLGFMVISGICTCYTSIILRYCLYEEDKDGKTVKTLHTFAEIGQKTCDSIYGAILTNVLMFAQAVLCGSYLILLAAVLINECVGIESLTVAIWMIIFTFISLPYAFMNSLKYVSQVSLIGNIAQAILTVTVMFYCFANIQKWKWDSLQGDIKLWSFTQSLTVILISFCSTYFAPMIDSSMSDASKYNCMMFWAHAIATVVKVFICGIVVLMWGNETKDTFTNNLPFWPYILFTNPVLAIRSLSNLINPYYLSITIVESSISKYFNSKKDLNEDSSLCKSVNNNQIDYFHDKEGYFKTWALGLRLSILFLMLLLALCIPFLQLVLGFLCCISGIPLLVILPCVFHLRLKKQTFLQYKMVNIVCILCGSALSIFGFIANIQVMFESK